jgi:hypothetical protein
VLVSAYLNSYRAVGVEVLTAVSTKMAVFWVVAPCSLLVVLRVLVTVYQTTRSYNPEYSHLPKEQVDSKRSDIYGPYSKLLSCYLLLLLATDVARNRQWLPDMLSMVGIICGSDGDHVTKEKGVSISINLCIDHPHVNFKVTF